MKIQEMSSTYIRFSIIPSLCYCYFISAKIPKGIPRLISLLPIIYIFTILPLYYYSSPFVIAVTTFSITWLSNFKLLLFAFDQGPLSKNGSTKNLSLPIFISMAALPLRKKQHISTQKFPLNLGSKIVLFSVILEIIFHYKSEMHPRLVLICYCLMIFLLIDILTDLFISIFKIFVGLELEPPSNEPYLSTSLQDFWARRWNLTVTNTLRLTVYNPVRLVLFEVVGKEWAQGVATLATFVVSGLMHELIFYYVTRVSPTWEMTWFFVIHGISVIVETRVKRAVKDTWRISGLVSGPLTIGFVVVTAFGLFFPPLIRNGADDMVLEEFGFCVDFIKDKMFQFVSHSR
ncbi:probable long-chain-alcohol O-fatty-acyltransferase 3 [Lycium ferocissimum]|uniref:probable long-chain-alcohol O-fatty-acyltransferase 3 n=1 Tax=Lycium ferocissimum TaxID=112874 RepID=UPI0028152502|nr:probable long-chain-alcohol O-fatty-acyltransferase 3 [Lycium ferocissimum]